MAKRTGIYYWKCDRPSAFFALRSVDGDTLVNAGVSEEKLHAVEKESVLALEVLEEGLYLLLKKFFGEKRYTLRKASGQGNHVTYVAESNEKQFFIRIENGPDDDDYMEVEAEIMRRLKKLGISTPHIYAVDASRKTYSFAYQIMENLAFRDLNELYRIGELDVPTIMGQLGKDMALWQSIPLQGFGPFDIDILREKQTLTGLHPNYVSYYTLNLKKHLDYLVEKSFLSADYASSLLSVIELHYPLMQIETPCLVHKDMALWNLLGESDTIQSYIDWDDAIAGDPCDDISLMGCFFSAKDLLPMIQGYCTVKPLPENFEKRFWLHLLRNMIFKAVIRVGAGYFQREGDFFLLGSVDSQESLKQITLNKIEAARQGLLENLPINTLL